jgi:hypothetical protein
MLSIRACFVKHYTHSNVSIAKITGFINESWAWIASCNADTMLSKCKNCFTNEFGIVHIRSRDGKITSLIGTRRIRWLCVSIVSSSDCILEVDSILLVLSRQIKL